MKIDYAFYIFLDKFLGIAFRRSFDAGKHGGLQQVVDRLMHTTL